MAIIERRLTFHLDWLLLVTVLVIVAMGITMIYSATQSTTPRLYISQLYALALGLLAMLVALTIDYRTLTDKSHWIYGLTLVLLAHAPAHHTDVDTRRSRLVALLAAFGPVAGVALFSAFLEWRFHDALAWLHGQAAWGLPLLGRASAPDPAPLPNVTAIKSTEVVTWIGNIAAFLIAASSIGPISRRLGPAYGAWLAVNLFPPVASHLFISIGRFIAVLFPFFFWLSVRIPRSRLLHVAALFTASQLLLAVWFFLWRPVV